MIFPLLNVYYMYVCFLLVFFMLQCIYVHICFSRKDNNFDEGPQIITMTYNNNNNNNIQSNDALKKLTY